jgi:hypothetical protein
MLPPDLPLSGKIFSIPTRLEEVMNEKQILRKITFGFISTPWISKIALSGRSEGKVKEQKGA